MGEQNINTTYSDEEIRKKLITLRNWTWIRRLILPVPIITVFVLFVLNLGEEMYFDEFAVNFLIPVGIVFFVAIFLYVLARSQVSKLKGFMGSAVTLPILKEIFEIKDYQPNRHLERSVISSAGLIDGWEDLEGSDYIEGNYRGIHFQYSDLLLSHKEEDTDSDGRRTTTHVVDFKGQWLVCDFGKELSASVRLIERKGGTKFQRKHDISKSDIETENLTFNKKYRIITRDGHTAFYLLTPHFMEQLIAADETGNASTLFSFTGGKVHIVLYSGRDSLELKGVKLNDMDNIRQKFRGDMKYMTGMMDELLQNDRLFKEA